MLAEKRHGKNRTRCPSQGSSVARLKPREKGKDETEKLPVRPTSRLEEWKSKKEVRASAPRAVDPHREVSGEAG